MKYSKKMCGKSKKKPQKRYIFTLDTGVNEKPDLLKQLEDENAKLKAEIKRLHDLERKLYILESRVVTPDLEELD